MTLRVACCCDPPATPASGLHPRPLEHTQDDMHLKMHTALQTSGSIGDIFVKTDKPLTHNLTRTILSLQHLPGLLAVSHWVDTTGDLQLW